MVKRIDKIENMGVFRDFNWNIRENGGAAASFKDINLIYGRNYVGKTTLSRIFRSLETGQLPSRYENPRFSLLYNKKQKVTSEDLTAHDLCVRVFNKDFIQSYLSFLQDEDGSIEPFAVLGDGNNTIEEELKALVSLLGTEGQGKESGLYLRYRESKTDYEKAKIAWTKADEDRNKTLKKKAIDKNTGIKYQPRIFGDQNYTTAKLEKEIATVLSPQYVPIDNDKKLLALQWLEEKARPAIPSARISPLSWEKIVKRSNEILSRQINATNKLQELLSSTELARWVKQGCELHDGESEVCAFCGNTIDQARWVALKSHFDDESNRLTKEIDEQQNAIKTEEIRVKKDLVIKPELFFVQFTEAVEELKKRAEKAVESYIQSLENIFLQLENKKGVLTQSLPLSQPENFASCIHDIFSEYEKLRIDSNAFSKELEKKQMDAQKALRLREVYEFSRAIDYDGIRKQIDEKEEQASLTLKAHKDLQNQIAEVEKRIDELQKKRVDEGKGAEKINGYLRSFFGHNSLSLRAVDNKADEAQVKFQIQRGENPAFNLSEGECSLIAFCYFVAKLGDKDTCEKRPIVWIDDPISSLDANHIYFMYSLIKAEIVQNQLSGQTFISTHNLEFFRYLGRLTNKKDQMPKLNRECYMVCREGETSTLRKMPDYMTKNVTEYNFLFNEIYKCSMIETPDDSNYRSFYNLGNDIRRFLEIHLFFKYPDQADPEEKLRKFFDDDEIPALLLTRINNENSHSLARMERGALPIEQPELHDAAQKVIEALKKDKEQFAAFMQCYSQETL